jgi:hypothetical protein
VSTIKPFEIDPDELISRLAGPLAPADRYAWADDRHFALGLRK